MKIDGSVDKRRQRDTVMSVFLRISVVLATLTAVSVVRPSPPSADLQRKVRLEDLRIEGNSRWSQRQIQAWLGVQRGAEVSRAQMRQHGLKVLERLNERGHYFAKIDSFHFDYNPDSTGAEVVVYLQEGNLLEVRELHLEGLPEKDSLLTEDLMTRPGEQFYAENLQSDIQFLIEQYENRGYPYCQVELLELSPIEHAGEGFVDIRLRITPGPQTEIGAIEIVGNDVTKDYVILRELGVTTGEIYDQRKIAEIPRRLNNLGFFEWVNPPRLVWRKNQTGKLIIELAEGSHNRFDGVVGYNPPQGNNPGFVTGLIDVSFRNLLGTGREAAVFWQRRTQKTQELRLTYLEPWVVGLPLNLGLSFSQLIQDTTYIERSFGFDAHFRLNYNLSFFSQLGSRTVSPDSLGAALFGIPKSRSVKVSLGVNFSTVDYAANPSTGVLYQASFEWRRKSIRQSRFDVKDGESGESLGSFNQRLLKIDFETYLSPFRWQVVAVSLHGRQITSDEEEIAISDQFRFGGTRDLRGYREEQFRGSRIAWANLEYRYLLNRNSRLFGFVDVGYFANNDRGSQIEDAKIGFGVGMRIDTRLGYFGIDYGLGQGDGLSNGKVHISLRNAFKAQQFVILARPLNLLLGILSIFLGAFITGTISPVSKVVLACAVGALVMAAGNAINDYFDLDIDRVNKPFRPLVSGQLQPREAIIFAIILFVLGIFLSIFINIFALSIALFTAIGLYAYGATLKRKILVGNIAVSVFTGLAFVFGAVSVDRWHKAIIPAGFAFLFHLGREIIKDVEDQAADDSCASQTLPILYGRETAFAIVTLVFTTLIVLSFVPYLLDLYGAAYLWTVAVGVDLVLVLTMVLMWLRPHPVSLRRISAVLKFDMFVGLLAIYLGQSSSLGRVEIGGV